MRGNGGFTFAISLVPRSRTLSSSWQFSRARSTRYETKSSWRRMFSSESAKATSGSTIQNSVRWRRGFDFGPDLEPGPLHGRPEPEVPVIQEEVDAVLLGLDGVLLGQ